MNSEISPAITKIQPVHSSSEKKLGYHEVSKDNTAAALEAATKEVGKKEPTMTPGRRKSFTENLAELTNKTKDVNLQEAKKATEKELRRAKKLFMMYLVRCDRLIILTAVLFLLISVLVEQGVEKCIIKHGKINQRDNITFEFGSCNLFIITVEEDMDQWQYETRNYLNAIVPSEDSFTAVSYFNQYYCQCQIKIKMNTLHHSPDLNVRINNNSAVDFMPQVYVTGTNGSLNNVNISSIHRNTRVEMKNIHIKNTISVNIISGSISLIDITMPKSNVDMKGNMLRVGDGNIFFSVKNNNLKLLHNIPTAGTCFRAKNISKYYYDKTNSNISNVIENTYQNSSVGSNKTSNKITRLCNGLSCRSNDYSYMDINVINGAFFAYLNSNAVVEDNNSTSVIDHKSSLTSSTLNISWLQLNDERSISYMKQFRKGMPNTDIYVLLKLDRSLGSPPHFFFTNKPVYLKLPPWILSSMSFGIVKPKVFKLNLQILPECGFDGLKIKTADDIGSLSNRLESMLKDDASDSIGARLVKYVGENENIEHVLKVLNIEQSRFNRDIDIVTSTYMVDSNGEYKEQIINNFDDWYLNSAILTSIFLAVVFGVTTVCISLKTGRAIIKDYFEKIDRYENFVKLQVEVEKPEYLVPAFKERYTKKMQSEKYENVEESRHIFLFILPEILLTLWNAARSNSLQLFLQQCSGPATSYGSQKGKRYEASKVQPMYEEFCKFIYASTLLHFKFIIIRMLTTSDLNQALNIGLHKKI
jgi:hypothetical protein